MRWMYTTSLILSRFLPLFHNPISNWKKKERKKKESNNSTRLSKCEEPQFSLFIPSSKGKKEKSDAPKTVDGREHGVKQMQTTARFLLTWFKFFYSKQLLWLCSSRVNFLAIRGEKKQQEENILVFLSRLFCLCFYKLGTLTCKSNKSMHTKFIKVKQQWVKLTVLS